MKGDHSGKNKERKTGKTGSFLYIYEESIMSYEDLIKYLNDNGYVWERVKDGAVMIHFLQKDGDKVKKTNPDSSET